MQSAAYITGENLYETRRALNVCYQNRQSDIAHAKTLIPDNVPYEFGDLNVWDKLESFEDTYAIKRFPNDLEAREKYMTSAQTAMTLVMALPKELAMDVNKELVEEFAKTRFVSRGLITTYALHDDEGNPHAHLQIARRSVNENGEIAWAKDRDICTRKELLATRKLWADLSNHYLEREGYDERITEKSFADLGIHLEPTQHRGWYASKLQSQNRPSRIVLENAQIFDDNKARILENPEIIVNEMTTKQATFTQIHLLKAIQKRLGDDAFLVASVFEGALEKSMVVGEGIDGQVRYTSTSYKALEDKAFSHLESLLHPQNLRETSSPFSSSSVDVLLNKHYNFLSDEQRHAVKGLTDTNGLAVLVGRAGAGKTTTLKAVSQMYQESGYTVIGTSLSALAAENLGSEAHIQAHTLHSLLYQWDRYHQAQEKFLSFQNVMEEGAFKQLEWYKDLKRFEGSQLHQKSVIIVDEAGMIGTRQWSELLHHAERAGAKVIAVGDDHQFKAIEAGDFFREMKERAGKGEYLFTLETIRRQKEMWMRQASQNLADLEIHTALSHYEKHGHIHASTVLHLDEDIAHAYVERVERGEKGLVLAFTNSQTHQLNNTIRDSLKKKYILDDKTAFTLRDKDFSIGDTLVFLKNDTQDVSIVNEDGEILSASSKGIFIKNGSRGTLESVNDQGQVIVRLNDHQRALFDPKIYDAVDYGYAVTAHKSQGQTVDFTVIAASKYMDAKGLYVAMTRHRNDVQLYYAQEDFASFKHLTHHLSRFEAKDLLKDYTIRPENEAAWQRVQEYQNCVLDSAAVLKEGGGDGVDWKAYHEIKQDQMVLGKEILSDFNRHKLYMEQAGMTAEMLAITIGIKARPLSLIEEKAKLTVEIYGETAILLRRLWKELQGQTLARNPRNLSVENYVQKYDEFQELRCERDSLAREILENYPLHRPFIQELQKEYGITKRTLENQVAYRERKRKEMEHPSPTILHKEENKNTIKNNHLINNVYVKYNENNGLEKGFSRPSFTRTSTDINTSLNACIKDLAFHFLGKPHHQTSREWRYGSKGSLSIQVAGTKQGLYANFETGESGRAVTFIAHQLGISSKEAFKWGAQWLGRDHVPPSTRMKDSTLPSPKATSEKAWIPVFPVKDSVASPDLKDAPQLQPLMRGRHEIDRFAYKDADGQLLGYVIRLEDKDGHKITPTLTYCRNERNEHQWRFQGFGDSRPLYGLEKLKDRPDAPILVVEGEKTADAASTLFKDHVVMTWSGGCGAVQKSDWSVLKGRDVTLWPDHDQAGQKAVQKIQEILSDKPTSLKIIDLPAELPHKWDLADKLPKGLQRDDLKEILENAKTVVLDKIPESQSLSPKQIEKIDHIIKNNRLQLSFGALNDKDYQNIHHTVEAFKTVQINAGKPLDDDWIFKRATFMVCYLKDQIHHVKLTSQETQKLALIASKQFADQKELGTLTSNSDAHYKARGFLRSQERNLGELQFLHQNNREKSIQDSPTLTKAEQNLHTIIGQINTEYRSAYESQQLQQMQERQIRLMRDRGVER